MLDGSVRTMLLNRLHELPALPEATLRAAYDLGAADTGLAAAVAARVDLPRDLRDLAAADGRPEVRAAFIARTDVDSAELGELMRAEHRTAVLVALAAAAEEDPVAHAHLWSALLHKPTKALALALLPAMARALTRPATIGGRPVPPGPPAPPEPVLVAALSTLGARPTGTRAQDGHIRSLATWLAEGNYPGAAQALALSPTAPDSLRGRLAGLPHLTAPARIALLEQVWLPQAQAIAVAGRRRAVSLVELRNAMPAQADPLGLLADLPDLHPDVLRHARDLLEREALNLPAEPLTWWRERLRTSSPVERCPQCSPAGAALPRWSPDLAIATDRARLRTPAPGSHPARRAATPAPAAAAGVTELAAAPGSPSVLQDGDDRAVARWLTEVSDAELVELTDDVVAAISSRQLQSASSALIDRLCFPAEQAAALLSQGWFRPSPVTLVRQVALRTGQPVFALAAAAAAFDSVVRAHGTSVFAAPGSADPIADGARALLNAVAHVHANRPRPGWESWADRAGGLDRSRVASLGALAARDDTPARLLLHLPWSVVSPLATSTSTRSWGHRETERLIAALDEALADLGAGAEGWATLAAIAPHWDGSAADLLLAVQATLN